MFAFEKGDSRLEGLKHFAKYFVKAGDHIILIMDIMSSALHRVLVASRRVHFEMLTNFHTFTMHLPGSR